MVPVEALNGRHFYRRDFSGQDLRERDLSRSIFEDCNFDDVNLAGNQQVQNSDFRCSSFQRTNCYGTNFTGSVFPGTKFNPADCYGMTITMTCKTFENAQVGQQWFYLFLMFAAYMRPEQHPVRENLQELLIAFIGSNRYLKLRNLLNRRSY